MKNTSIIQLTKNNSAINSLPNEFGSIVNPDLKMSPEIKVIFVDETWIDHKPTLDYYRKLYAAEGYSSEMIESLLEGLSKSSLYEGKNS